MQAGDTIRITARLQDAVSGEVLASEQVDGSGESSIFTRVDDLTRRLRTRLALSPAPEDGFDRGITEVTTDSVAAYRYFVEGRNLHLRGAWREAIPFYEKAVELDPGFAMAYRAL